MEEKKNNYSGLRHLFQITQVQMILTLLFAGFLHLVDPLVYDFYDLTLLQIPDNSDYVTFLVTISGIGGVFIGLYYAGISTIGGAIYARVPNNIRDLLAQERIGNVYMHVLSFITFLGISLVALRVLGFDRIYLAIPIMTFASGIGIISFVKLGQRAFYLFDPTALSHHLFDQLKQYLNMVKAGSYRWNDASFQKHAHKLASSNLDTLETLSDITKKEIHLNGGPFISLSKNLILFLRFYENSKKYIPSDSQWYEQKYEHRDWYRTEDSRVSIAHQTGTSLQPEVTNDKEWVEARVIPIIKECLRINLKEERYNEVLELAEYLDAYLKLLARNGRINRALTILEELVESVLDVISPESKNELVANEVLEKLAIIERVALMPITIALACREHIEDIDAEKVEKKLSKITWEKDGDLYKHEFPSYCLPRLEWFKPRLSFEVTAEGYRVTPIWYQKELLLQIETDAFVENTDSLISKCSKLYDSWISKTLDAKHQWLAGAVISREWEFWHKVDFQIEIWPEKWENLSEKRKIEGLPWAEFRCKELQEASKNRQAELLKLMSKQNLMLAFLKRPEGFPDYAGQFLHTSGEVVFEALLTNDIDLLSSIFEVYLYGCIMRFDSLRPKTTTVGWRVRQDFKIATAALLDVMDISGYARLMADYYGNEQLWRVVVTAWDKYFAERREVSPLPLFAEVIVFTEGVFEIPHRGALRTNWQMRISGKMSDVPRHEAHSNHYLGLDTIIDHNSLLVRMFASAPCGSFHDGIDIFITFYLRTKDGAGNLDFGWKRRDLQESLDREARNNEQNEGEENSE